MGNANTSGNIDANESTASFTLRAGRAIHAYGNFGGGTLVLQIKIAGAWYTLRDEASAAEFSATDDASFLCHGGNQECRLTLSGATSPDIDWVVC